MMEKDLRCPICKTGNLHFEISDDGERYIECLDCDAYFSYCDGSSNEEDEFDDEEVLK